MIFLDSFKLLSDREEHFALGGDNRMIYNSYYPFGLFSYKQLREVKFDNITIFYGGNGSGKTTLLNVIAEKIHANRKNKIDKGNLFKLYVDGCEEGWKSTQYDDIRMISSDDIFDYLLDIRAINTNVNRKKEELSREYLNNKFTDYRGYNSSRDNYDDLKDMTDNDFEALFIERKDVKSLYHRLDCNYIHK